MSKEREAGPGLRMANAGFELAAAVGGFAAIGWWLDRHYGWQPWGLLAGAVAGLVGGLYNLLRSALEASREAEQEAREERASPPGKRPGE